jgi:hypothetical protein
VGHNRIDFARKIFVVLVLGLVLSASSLSIKTVNAQAGQVTLKPTDDTYVDSENAFLNYGGESVLHVEWFDISQLNIIMRKIVLVKFDLSPVPEGAEVDRATLQLYAFFGAVSPPPVCVYFCSDNSWGESWVIYNNLPSYNATPMDSEVVGGDSQWVNWSVLGAVNSLNGYTKKVTVVLGFPSALSVASEVFFASKEYNSPIPYEYAPQLIIHWSSVVPEFPTFLILPLFMMATLLALVFHKQSRHRKGSSQIEGRR